eukprot:CAMPEP_0197439496 /NCGR_PEP_ID=MMETSP1175-20131217/6221_1 /TAXON_ID=1003142 /ORGANISM="Triceratium dubium, Strain CCMP147" /LENGTH=519 /DNA_ID=CAMNT_0042969421 /DNA_START=5 /DNA_END=1564 /DNA_ORIENTATION=-
MEKKTACVIGLGPAGLVAVKELNAAGFDVVGYDALSRIGGRWSLDPSYATGGVWKEMYWNGERRKCGYSDFPWHGEDYDENDAVEKDLLGLFPHSTEARAYLEAYADHNNLKPLCRLNTRVLLAERDQKTGRWNVTTKSGDDKETTRVFDYLAVCPGRQAKARNQLEGKELANYQGKLMHSSELKSIRAFEGQRVLVVGASASGSDISSHLAREGGCSRVVNSVRRVPYHMDRVSPVNDLSLDDFLAPRLAVWLGRHFPDDVVNRGFKALVLENFPSQLTEEITGSAELVPDKDIRKAGLGLSSDYVSLAKEGKLTVKPAVQSAFGTTVRFADESTEEFDTIICGTGYDVDMSFLDKEVQRRIQYTSPFTGAEEVALYKHTLMPDYDNIAFLGLYNGAGPIYMSFELQARYIAKLWTGSLAYPSERAIKAGVDKFKEYREVGPHHATELSIDVAETIADELKLTPSFLEALLDRRLLTGAVYPCYYRIKDEVESKGKPKNYQKLFDYYMEHPGKAAKEY